jgi:hypothetical protein
LIEYQADEIKREESLFDVVDDGAIQLLYADRTISDRLALLLAPSQLQ